MKARPKASRTGSALVAALLWAYAPLFPASLCVASGAMAAQQPAQSAHCAHRHEAPSQPARSHCTDPETSCCLSVSPDGVVGAATFQLDTTVVAVACPAVSHDRTVCPASAWLPPVDSSPPKRLPPPLTSVFRL